ncbi:hypothetical protein H7X68_03300 [Candidatus Saccharibacteria bacterium]|nr:hypothetical protein [Candidatus Saccharibacteria bacterium]
MNKTNKKSALTYMLLAFVPYTRQNLLLSFRPNQFFNELEKTSGHSTTTLRTTFSRAKKDNLITLDNDQVSLSLKGRQIIQPFIAQDLNNGEQLMVIFDIPEDFANLRRKLRILLRQLEFQQVQQSVWMSDKDHREILAESIKNLQMDDWVQLYKSARIDIS